MLADVEIHKGLECKHNLALESRFIVEALLDHLSEVLLEYYKLVHDASLQEQFFHLEVFRLSVTSFNNVVAHLKNVDFEFLLNHFQAILDRCVEAVYKFKLIHALALK